MNAPNETDVDHVVPLNVIFGDIERLDRFPAEKCPTYVFLSKTSADVLISNGREWVPLASPMASAFRVMVGAPRRSLLAGVIAGVRALGGGAIRQLVARTTDTMMSDLAERMAKIVEARSAQMAPVLTRPSPAASTDARCFCGSPDHSREAHPWDDDSRGMPPLPPLGDDEKVPPPPQTDAGGEMDVPR